MVRFQSPSGQEGRFLFAVGFGDMVAINWIARQLDRALAALIVWFSGTDGGFLAVCESTLVGVAGGASEVRARGQSSSGERGRQS